MDNSAVHPPLGAENSTLFYFIYFHIDGSDQENAFEFRNALNFVLFVNY